MIRTITGATLLAALVLGAGGCAAVQSTADIAVGYNRTFAQARDEILLLNILRAAAREPLQFSTMGNISGTVGNGLTLQIPFTNVVAGGRDVISPSLSITDSVNPTVGFVPLSNQDFARGILTPISASGIQLFLHGGWDAEFLLPLIVGGVVCADGRLLLNSGEYEADGSTATHEVFREFFHRSARSFAVDTQEADESDRQTFTVSDERAVALLRDGLGANYTVLSVEDQAPGTKRVTIAPARAFVVRGLDIPYLCAALPGRDQAVLTNASERLGGVRVADTTGRVIFRSVETMIYYLGESHRVRMRASTRDQRGLTYLNQSGRVQILFRADAAATSGTGRAVQTSFHDRVFYVARLALGEAEGDDRTLKTLSFLDQLVALQTSEATIRSAQPLLAIQQ